MLRVIVSLLGCSTHRTSEAAAMRIGRKVEVPRVRAAHEGERRMVIRRDSATSDLRHRCLDRRTVLGRANP
jgi:hypothetical protein